MRLSAYPFFQGHPLRAAVHAQPELVERAAERIQSYMVKEHLLDRAAYQKGGMIKVEIDGILAEEFCADLLALVYESDYPARLGI